MAGGVNFKLSTNKAAVPVHAWFHKTIFAAIFEKKSEFQCVQKNTQNYFAYMSATKYRSEAILYSLAKIGADSPLFATRTKLFGQTDRKTDGHTL